MSYRPKDPFSVHAELYNSVDTVVKGVQVKNWTKTDDIMCSFKTYGGTESISNGVMAVIDTASVETWYRPDITSASQLRIGSKTYAVIGEPEDIDSRHQFLKFKVRGGSGGA